MLGQKTWRWHALSMKKQRSPSWMQMWTMETQVKFNTWSHLFQTVQLRSVRSQVITTQTSSRRCSTNRETELWSSNMMENTHLFPSRIDEKPPARSSNLRCLCQVSLKQLTAADMLAARRLIRVKLLKITLYSLWINRSQKAHLVELNKKKRKKGKAFKLKYSRVSCNPQKKKVYF